ncbi:MAG: hypothetical protein JRN35_04710 [Nitrososphaerota archaeon]|nr:hypothetical protein [Nitrososphaerota archaeon]
MDVKSPLRWKEHSLFPYACKGCGTKHPKGDGVYLDQSGPRTATYDNPLCAQQAVPVEKVQKSPVTTLQTQLTPSRSVVASLPTPAVGSDHPERITLTVDLQGGRSVEVILRMHGDGLAKPTVDRLVADVSRVVMEDLA